MGKNVKSKIGRKMSINYIPTFVIDILDLGFLQFMFWSWVEIL